MEESVEEDAEEEPVRWQKVGLSSSSGERFTVAWFIDLPFALLDLLALYGLTVQLWLL